MIPLPISECLHVNNCSSIGPLLGRENMDGRCRGLVGMWVESGRASPSFPNGPSVLVQQCCTSSLVRQAFSGQKLPSAQLPVIADPDQTKPDLCTFHTSQFAHLWLSHSVRDFDFLFLFPIAAPPCLQPQEHATSSIIIYRAPIATTQQNSRRCSNRLASQLAAYAPFDLPSRDAFP